MRARARRTCVSRLVADASVLLRSCEASSEGKILKNRVGEAGDLREQASERAHAARCAFAWASMTHCRLVCALVFRRKAAYIVCVRMSAFDANWSRSLQTATAARATNDSCDPGVKFERRQRRRRQPYSALIGREQRGGGRSHSRCVQARAFHCAFTRARTHAHTTTTTTTTAA